ncbi:MAG TPA: hypothetical protein VIB38_14740 [Aestuariivirgaceae bacterium]|jgi:hypothetical protein
MYRTIAIIALAGALLAAGAYAPPARAIGGEATNVTVVAKNQIWPQPELLDACELSLCQDV